jgi:hypothetical protein
VTSEVRALVQERQDRRKAELDAHRRDERFAVGDEVLLETEHTPLPLRLLLSPRWMGPFKVLACPAPNTYRLDHSSSWRVFNKFNVDRLRPYVRSTTHLGGETGPPAPVVGRARTARRSTRWRSCSRTRCATAGPTSWCDGPAATLRATRGSRWRT